MKSESYILANSNVLKLAILRLKDMPLDGKVKLTISDAKGKSTQQRHLQWLWYTEVANSGIGGEYEDTKENVHRLSKYRWAVPILIRDNDFFSDLYAAYISAHIKDPDRMAYFIDEHVHTEKFNTSQMAEYLTSFQRYYVEKGVRLTDPDDLKLLQYNID